MGRWSSTTRDSPAPGLAHSSRSQGLPPPPTRTLPKQNCGLCTSAFACCFAPTRGRAARRPGGPSTGAAHASLNARDVRPPAIVPEEACRPPPPTERWRNGTPHQMHGRWSIDPSQRGWGRVCIQRLSLDRMHTNNRIEEGPKRCLTDEWFLTTPKPRSPTHAQARVRPLPAAIVLSIAPRTPERETRQSQARPLKKPCPFSTPHGPSARRRAPQAPPARGAYVDWGRNLSVGRDACGRPTGSAGRTNSQRGPVCVSARPSSLN